VKYLLDTDHLSIIQRQSGPAYARLRARIAQKPLEDLSCSIISFHEQALGCHSYINRAQSSGDVVRGYEILHRVLWVFAATPVIPFDDAAATVFTELVTRRVRVTTMDLRIASIALSRSMVLVTRNVGDFVRVPGLQIEDWTL